MRLLRGSTKTWASGAKTREASTGPSPTNKGPRLTRGNVPLSPRRDICFTCPRTTDLSSASEAFDAAAGSTLALTRGTRVKLRRELRREAERMARARALKYHRLRDAREKVNESLRSWKRSLILNKTP